jgi:hypothetical protein
MHCYFFLRNRPDFLEFFSYCFCYQTVLVGPLYTFKDYIEFITGDSIIKHQVSIKDKSIQPDNKAGLCGFIAQKSDNRLKIVLVSVDAKIPDDDYAKCFLHESVNQQFCDAKSRHECCFVSLMLSRPLKFLFFSIKEKEILASPFVYRIGYMVFTAFNERVLFYLMWTLCDMACIASGLGFNGYDENNSAKWDLAISVNIFKFEASLPFELPFSARLCIRIA